jgi:hypothetical protein
VLYAKIIRKYNVNFVVSGDTYAHKVVQKGNTTSVANPTSTDRSVFLGWSLNGADIVNPSTTQIWQHTTFFAVIQTRYFVEFNVCGSAYQTQWVVKGHTVTPPTINIVGYQFNYWTFNGAEVNPLSLEIYQDKVYVANITVLELRITLPTPLQFANVEQYDITNYLTAAYPSISFDHIQNIVFSGLCGDTTITKKTKKESEYTQTRTQWINGAPIYIPEWRSSTTTSFGAQIINGRCIIVITTAREYIDYYNSANNTSTIENGTAATIKITDIYLTFKESWV